MPQRTHPRHGSKPRHARPARHRADRPERHSIARIAATIPPHQEATRISGVLATLERIARLPDTI